MTRRSIAAIFFCVIYFLLAIFVVPRSVLHDALIALIPKTLLIHFVLLVAAAMLVFWNRRDSIRRHAGFLFAATMLGVVGVAAALLLAPATHRVYFDEDIYIQIGHSIAHDSRAGMLSCAVPAGQDQHWTGREYELNKEPTGYPFLVSLVSRLMGITGINDQAGARTSLAMFFIGIVMLSILSREIGSLLTPAPAKPWRAPRGEREPCAAGRGSPPRTPPIASERFVFVAPLCYALWPENLRWAVTGATEISAASLAISALAMGFVAARSRRREEMTLAVLVLALAVQVRPEGFLLLVPFCIAAMGRDSSERRPWSWTFRQIGSHACPYAAIFIVLILPHAVHLFSMSGESWGATGPKFSFEYVRQNLAENTRYWVLSANPRNTPPPPLLFSELAGIGLVAMIIKGCHSLTNTHVNLLRNDTLVIVSWLLLFFGVFIPFYAGSYYYGVDVRFSLLVVAPFLVLTAGGIRTISDIVSTVVRFAGERMQSAIRISIAALLIAYPLAEPLLAVRALSAEARQARADHAAVELWAKRLPSNAVVVSHTPAMWANRGFAAVQLVWALAHPAAMADIEQQYPLYYHNDFWDIAGTSSDGTIRPGSAGSAGQLFMSRYDTEQIGRVEADDKWVFRLLRIHTGKREGPAPWVPAPDRGR